MDDHDTREIMEAIDSYFKELIEDMVTELNRLTPVKGKEVRDEERI